MKDDKGNTVKVGNFVEILSINEESLKLLEPEYANEIRDAVGQKLEVHEIDEHDRAWVDLISESKDEERCGQTLFLSSYQIRKV